ncbi:12443_t:CDS:2, partial [Ambispora leptoticha]
KYPLTVAYPNIQLVTNPNPPANRIPLCSLCKANTDRNYPPYLHQIPSEINLVSLEKRKYLSPIFLHCSLGCIPRTNPFSEYRSLVATHLSTDENAPPYQHGDIVVPHQTFPNEDAYYSHLM